MKKLFALTLVLLLVAGCGSTTVKLGTGIVTGMSGSAATADADGKIQATVSVVSAAFDANGKVLAATIDAVQPKGTFDATGALKFDPAGEVKTKNELGDDYGMRKNSAIGKEVNEQYAALASYMVGKNAKDLISMPTYKRDDSHTAVPDVEELKTTCTIDVGALLKAFEKAYNTAK